MTTDRTGYTDRELILETRARVEALYTAILGNGQPGRLQRIEEDIDGLKTETVSCKTDRAAAHGAVRVLKWLVGLIGGTELVHVASKWKP